MEKKIIDARGELCPKPLIMTKKALKDFEGELTVLLDNETAYENVQRFLSDNGKDFTASHEGNNYTIAVNADGDSNEMSAAEDYCTVPLKLNKPASEKTPSIIVFSSDKMGEGADDLGRILMQGFCNTIKEVENLPETLVFYNSGVHLAAEGSPVLPALLELEQSGIRVLVCGTCSDFFDIKAKVRVGVISNMYDIMDCLTSAGKIIYA